MPAEKPGRSRRTSPSCAHGYAPNLDVLVTYAGDTVNAAIECKFCEPFSTRTKAPLSEKYLDSAFDALWDGIPALRAIAGRCCDSNVEDFTHLDVPQLLKHVLGLRRRTGPHGCLSYRYYDPFGKRVQIRTPGG
jgi:hypothetical protein